MNRGTARSTDRSERTAWGVPVASLKEEAPGCNRVVWSGRKDLNLRPLRPERSALPGCATPRQGDSQKTGTGLSYKMGVKRKPCASATPGQVIWPFFKLTPLANPGSD